MPTSGVSVSRCLVANHPEAHTSTVSSGDWALGAPCVSAAISWATLLLGADRMLAEVKGTAGPSASRPPGLVQWATAYLSLLPHSVVQSKSQGQPLFKGRGRDSTLLEELQSHIAKGHGYKEGVSCEHTS